MSNIKRRSVGSYDLCFDLSPLTLDASLRTRAYTFLLSGPGGGMVDTADLKSVDREIVRVRVPPRAPTPASSPANANKEYSEVSF